MLPLKGVNIGLNLFLDRQQSSGIMTTLEKCRRSQRVSHVDPDGEWRRETAKQMLNVLCENPARVK